MLDWNLFATLLCKYTKAQVVSDSDVLFGGGLDISSILFTEFIMELEEQTNRDIDVDGLDASIRTAGQLYAELSSH